MARVWELGFMEARAFEEEGGGVGGEKRMLVHYYGGN